MLTNKPQTTRIFGRVALEEFVGRSAELTEILNFVNGLREINGLLLLHAPAVGASELLRQVYDNLFYNNHNIIPIYFSLHGNERNLENLATSFLQTFLSQVIAYRKRDVEVLDAGLALNDLISAALPADLEWIEDIVDAFETERGRGDSLSLLRLSLSAPQRAVRNGIITLLMFDGFHKPKTFDNGISIGEEILQACSRLETPYILSGLRRRMLHLVQHAQGSLSNFETLRVDRLSDNEAATLVEILADRNHVTINDETRDLIVQELGASPFFITALIECARKTETPLDSFRNCQQLYVNELFGGQIERYYTGVFEEIASDKGIRHALIQLLYQTIKEGQKKKSLEGWRKSLGLDHAVFQKLMHGLHINEMISLSANHIEMLEEKSLFRDYIKSMYRLEIANEPRALVVADVLLESLKRAPVTMAKSYRRLATIGLREILSRFNCQEVSADLLDYDKFCHLKGALTIEIDKALNKFDNPVHLPQIVYATSGAAYHPALLLNCEEERCVIAHGFENGEYYEDNEVVWIAVEIESKTEVGSELATFWSEKLSQLVSECGFQRTQFWFISNEGFTAEASSLMFEKGIYNSCRQQLNFLLERLKIEGSKNGRDGGGGGGSDGEGYELILPMQEDAELIAAEAVENMARRVGFNIEAVNQIKTAIIEACINATEHSFSPDRRIRLKISFADRKLSITIASRGVVPKNLQSRLRAAKPGGKKPETDDLSETTRGWGLTLIRTLMDEVTFERVDDGTSLRMAKWLR